MPDVRILDAPAGAYYLHAIRADASPGRSPYSPNLFCCTGCTTVSAARLQRLAQRKAQSLLRVVDALPFASDRDRASWLAALFTLVAGAACMPAPLFVVSACERGLGHNLVVDALSLIATGLLAPRLRHNSGEADQRRQVLHTTRAKLPLVLLHDVNVPVGSVALDAALTAKEWKVPNTRKHGTVTLQLCAVWFAAGVSVAFRRGTETPHRAVRIHLAPPPGWTGEPARLLRPWLTVHAAKLRETAQQIVALRHRASLLSHSELAQAEQLAAATSMLEAYDTWSLEVRALILWLGYPDPVLPATRGQAVQQHEAREPA